MVHVILISCHYGFQELVSFFLFLTAADMTEKFRIVNFCALHQK